ncbi:MAG: acylphosphatase [Comamonadaceae bacterium]|nr:acylphosphatase [Comamonadaceae bacterium]
MQGVYYRASTEQTALRLGLTGWVRSAPMVTSNSSPAAPRPRSTTLSDGWQGPPAARVDAVERRDVPFEAFAGFSVRR